MNVAAAKFRTASSTLEVGPIPRVVATLSAFPAPASLPGDIVEVRLDKMQRPWNWLEQCELLQARNKPVLLTIRLKAEGGDWDLDGTERLALYLQSLPRVAAIDVELNSAIATELAQEAAEYGCATVISFHDFQKTPPREELCSIIRRQHAIGSVAKIAAMIRQPSDADVLRSILKMEWPKPVCLIAMGQEYSETRIEFATLGSCLTYGYLDFPTAPGQISAADLVARLEVRLHGS